jgi:hypothetical protein
MSREPFARAAPSRRRHPLTNVMASCPPLTETSFESEDFGRNCRFHQDLRCGNIDTGEIYLDDRVPGLNAGD